MPKFNAHLLHAETKKLPTMPDEESILITSFVNTMGNLKETMVQNEETMAQERVFISMLNLKNVKVTAAGENCSKSRIRDVD